MSTLSTLENPSLTSSKAADLLDLDEVAQMAQNLARRGYAVFPVSAKKRPTVEGWDQRASTDPTTIRDLWRECPGPLIGVVTGERSEIDVLDVDIGNDHPAAQAWLEAARSYLPLTRTWDCPDIGGLYRER